MTVPVDLIFGLLVFFLVKHFVADFVLQNVWMLQKARPGWDFVVPLALHCVVHSGLTLIACWYINPTYWWLALVDFVIHFTMDRIKAGPRYFGRYRDPKAKAYWVTFGFDQLVHHLTDLLVIYVLVIHA